MRISIDLGGTKTEGIVMDDQGEIVCRLRRPTPQTDGYQSILDPDTIVLGGKTFALCIFSEFRRHITY